MPRPNKNRSIEHVWGINCRKVPTKYTHHSAPQESHTAPPRNHAQHPPGITHSTLKAPPRNHTQHTPDITHSSPRNHTQKTPQESQRATPRNHTQQHPRNHTQHLPGITHSTPQESHTAAPPGITHSTTRGITHRTSRNHTQQPSLASAVQPAGAGSTAWPKDPVFELIWHALMQILGLWHPPCGRPVPGARPGPEIPYLN